MTEIIHSWLFVTDRRADGWLYGSFQHRDRPQYKYGQFFSKEAALQALEGQHISETILPFSDGNKQWLAKEIARSELREFLTIMDLQQRQSEKKVLMTGRTETEVRASET